MTATKATIRTPATLAANAGWREIGGRRIYFRSKWEANYARYLEWLKGQGSIKEWEYEPETFWFDKIKRGTTSYKPDFAMIEHSGARVFYEVKGWMTPRSKTALKRMAKYYPDVVMNVLRQRDIASIKASVGGLIPGWEA